MGPSPDWSLPPQINKLHLCKPLIRAIDSSTLRSDYSPAQKVTYKYYVGRKAMFDSDFKPGPDPDRHVDQHHRVDQDHRVDQHRHAGY